MPLAILIGLSVVTAFYLSMNISYYTVLNIPQLLESNAVAVVISSIYSLFIQGVPHKNRHLVIFWRKIFKKFFLQMTH
jgi:hypothetical protein